MGYRGMRHQLINQSQYLGYDSIKVERALRWVKLRHRPIREKPTYQYIKINIQRELRKIIWKIFNMFYGNLC